MANCIPSISFLPPEAESPEAGSNTPILTCLLYTSHSEQATYRKVAITLPEMEPMPPMTTMSRIS